MFINNVEMFRENIHKIQIISGKMEKVKKLIIKRFQTCVWMHHFEDK